jgi:ribosomal protein S18 acetylase RimI-like enzyme
MDLIVTTPSEASYIKELNQYFQHLKKEFASIPWISSVNEIVDQKNYLLIQNGQFIAGISLYIKCPEEDILKQKSLNIFGPQGVFISCLYVNPSFRNNGYGKRVLNRILNDIFYDFKYAWGIVTTKNTELIDFYKKHFNVEIIKINNEISLIKFEQ